MHRTAVAAALIASFLTLNPSLVDPFWNLISSLWSESSLDEGCGMDPNGRCLPAPQPTSDAGCGMDPFGRCLPGS